MESEGVRARQGRGRGRKEKGEDNGEYASSIHHFHHIRAREMERWDREEKGGDGRG